jgi:predicted nucleotidyltransferase
MIGYKQDLSQINEDTRLIHMMTESQTTSEITRRIVEAVKPQRVVLFGSRARGDSRGDSDFDVLIIAPSDEKQWKRTLPVYKALAGMRVPTDVVWFTQDEINEWRNVKSHFITTALREGKVLYEVSA